MELPWCAIHDDSIDTLPVHAEDWPSLMSFEAGLVSVSPSCRHADHASEKDVRFVDKWAAVV